MWVTSTIWCLHTLWRPQFEFRHWWKRTIWILHKYFDIQHFDVRHFDNWHFVSPHFGFRHIGLRQKRKPEHTLKSLELEWLVEQQRDGRQRSQVRIRQGLRLDGKGEGGVAGDVGRLVQAEGEPGRRIRIWQTRCATFYEKASPASLGSKPRGQFFKTHVGANFSRRRENPFKNCLQGSMLWSKFRII
jgi:hypothetical protein